MPQELYDKLAAAGDPTEVKTILDEAGVSVPDYPMGEPPGGEGAEAPAEDAPADGPADDLGGDMGEGPVPYGDDSGPPETGRRAKILLAIQAKGKKDAAKGDEEDAA